MAGLRGYAGMCKGPGSPAPMSVTIEQLGRMAREFDQISREDGRDWPAVRFVEWLADEWRASVPAEETEQRDAA